jgi:hypothetical protein
MYTLIGIKNYIHNDTPDGFDIREERHRLAHFTTKEKAEAYIEASKLKSYNPSYCSSWRNPNKRFRKGSLLRGCDEAVIEEEVELPINPEVK